MKSRKLIAAGIIFALISVIGIILVSRDKPSSFVAAVHATFSRGRRHQIKSKSLDTPSEGGRL